MKLFICFCAVLMIFISNCVFAITTDEYVNALEVKLFGTTYENQDIQSRIDRIEQEIYENTYSGSPEERLSKIDKIYPKQEFEIATNQTFNNSTTVSEEKSDTWYSQDYPEKEEYNNYPVVNEIEEHIYKKTFQGEDIYKRLARLETELYGNVKNDMSLYDRVENLKSVLPQKGLNRFSASNFGFNDFGLNQPKEYVTDTNFNSEQIIRELEIETFNKSYDNENSSHRLERLESYYFGSISSGQSEQERLNRIATMALSNHGMKDYFPSAKGAQWAGILMNLLIIGLGFLL